MIASILSKCGVDFGSSEELMPPNHANILGYFEHQDIAYQINNPILEHFGGSWNNPPDLADDWHKDQALAPIRKKALSIVAGFSGKPSWGWKDPRTSLLIPFWESILGNLKYIVCLRNPLDVAQSLNKRDGISLEDGSKLWYQYVASALKHTTPENRRVVFYENFFIDPQQELKNLLVFLNIPIREKYLQQSNTVFAELRHYKSSTVELGKNIQINEASKMLYLQIIREAAQSEHKSSANIDSDGLLSAGRPEITTRSAETMNRKAKHSTKTAAPLLFPKHEVPIVSIVVPTFNRSKLLEACVRSVLQYTEIAYELIIVDDASSDDTESFLEQCTNVTIIRNPGNLDFLKSANIGAGAARGKYIIFLNNDVTVRAGWASELVRTIREIEGCGAVGVKLVSMDGKLQEAGAIVNHEGVVELYGAGDNPFKPEYNFVRETDYCSAACLLIEKDVFFDLGTFDERYAPAYYEDVDICMGVWGSGHKVIYQPSVTVFHHQMGSRPHKRALELVERNKPIFEEKWRQVIRAKRNNDDILLCRHKNKHSQLAYIAGGSPNSPGGDEEAVRFQHLMQLSCAGYAISYIPTKDHNSANDFVQKLQQAGQEVFYGSSFSAHELLKQRAGLYQVIVIGHDCDQTFYRQHAKHFFPGARIIDENDLAEFTQQADANE